MIKPLVVSSGFGAGFNSQFIWTGITLVEKPQIIIMMIFFTCGLEERDVASLHWKRLSLDEYVQAIQCFIPLRIVENLFQLTVRETRQNVRVRWEGECIPCDEIASHMGRKGEHLLSLKKNNKMKQSEITNKIKSQTIRVFSHSLNFYHLRVKSGENFPIIFSFLQQVWEITVPTWL